MRDAGSLAVPEQWRIRKRVRPPGSVPRVTIAERGVMRYTFHGGGPSAGALKGAVMPDTATEHRGSQAMLRPLGVPAPVWNQKVHSRHSAPTAVTCGLPSW
jgi:hypothetical protein